MTKHPENLPLIIFCIWFAVPEISNSQGMDASGHTFSKSNFFHVQSFAGGPSSQKVLDLCDSLRIELQSVWGTKERLQLWEPRCEVILHRSRSSYHQAVGPGSGSTNGSSLVQLNSGVIASRRIDLMMDQNGALTALPHELSHVILADCFRGRQPPLWLDEGIAMLADTHEKQLLHERDCMDAVSSKNALNLEELVRLEVFNSTSQVAAFYGQSLTLVRMLAQRKSTGSLIDFANDTIDSGIATALMRHYDIDGVRELERQWKIELHAFHRSEKRMPLASARFKP